MNRRVLQCTIQDIWDQNAEADPDEVQRIVDEAVSEVREERRALQGSRQSLMRAVVDTNIVVSRLLAPAGKPAAIMRIWLDGKFTLLSCLAQRAWLVNQIQKLAADVDPLVSASEFAALFT